MKHNVLPSQAMKQQLYEHFPEDTQKHIQALTAPPKQAPLYDVPGEFVPYVRSNHGASRPFLYISGFGEGITNKLPTAVALARKGLDVILPGQNRGGLVPVTEGKNVAIETQARNILAVAEHAGVLEEFDILAHSFGGLVAAEVVSQLNDMGFDTSKMNVILLASAGVGKEISYRAIAKRWLKMVKSEFGPKNKEFPDYTGEMGKASLRNLAANPRQTLAEIRALRHETLDVRKFCRMVGRVVLVSYADDEMYPQDHTYPAIEEALAQSGVEESLDQPGIENFVVITPVAYGNPELGEALGLKPAAVHDDEQLNPSRVVNAIAPFLRRINK